MKGRWWNLIFVPISMLAGALLGGLLGEGIKGVGEDVGAFVGLIAFGLTQIHIVFHHPDK